MTRWNHGLITNAAPSSLHSCVCVHVCRGSGTGPAGTYILRETQEALPTLMQASGKTVSMSYAATLSTLRA
jgi:hypothetical protein